MAGGGDCAILHYKGLLFKYIHFPFLYPQRFLPMCLCAHRASVPPLNLLRTLIPGKLRIQRLPQPKLTDGNVGFTIFPGVISSDG